jgi:cytochrome oxidase Cu insertion factor (SCO1/SenC/PrrC family)
MFIYKVLFKELVKGYGFTPEIEAALAAYNKEPSKLEWKAFVFDEVLKVRERLNAKSAPDFKLTDLKEKIISKSTLKGKLAIFDFWFTGCSGCVQMVPQMKKLEEEFKSDTNVVFVNVSVDSDKAKWVKSVAQQKYTTGTGLSVYTSGQGDNHPMIKYYGITGYPSLMFLDPYGRAINVYPRLDPRSDSGRQRMSDFIHRQLAEMKDGPYIIYETGKSNVYSFNGPNVVHSVPSGGIVESATDDPKKMLKISLKKVLKNETAVFERPGKLIALSDIEGNFTAFRTLLQKNKVIDENYNWIFGNGHLVFAGDMFDRGNQVTECLWLIYTLEEKAKAAGGYVHYVLGNHEIMNLQGNHSYAQPKYTANSEVLGKTIKELYNEDSELGRWLRTKNIMEQIGDLMFVHGGLGMEFTGAVALSISEINARARKYYADERAKENPDENVRMIFDEFRGPLWYRRYYEQGDKSWVNVTDTTVKITVRHPTEAQLDSILNKYDAKYIITGHTIVADTISTLYNNKVINTDVPHAKGKSEALLIEGNNFYRVNAEGKRWLLFREEEKKPNR